MLESVRLEHSATTKFLKHKLYPGAKYYLRLRATDHAGHVSKWVYSDGVIADDTPPQCAQLPMWSLAEGKKPQFTGNEQIEMKWKCADPESSMGSIAVCVTDLSAENADDCVIQYVRTWRETTRIAASSLFRRGPRFSASVSVYNNALLTQRKLLHFILDSTAPKCTLKSWVSKPSRRRLLLASKRRSLRVKAPVDYSKNTVYISSVDMIRPFIGCVDKETEITLQQVAIGTLPTGKEVCNWRTLLQEDYTSFKDCDISRYAKYRIYITAKARNALWTAENKHMQSVLVSPPFMIDVTKPTVSFAILETNGVAMDSKLALIGASKLRIKIGAVEDVSPFSHFIVCFEQDTKITYSKYKADALAGRPTTINPTGKPLCQEVNTDHATLNITKLAANALTRIKVQAFNAAKLKSSEKVVGTLVIKDSIAPHCAAVHKVSDDSQGCMVFQAKECKDDLEDITSYAFELRETDTKKLIKRAESPGTYQRICFKLTDGTKYTVSAHPVDIAGHVGKTRLPYTFAATSKPPKVTSVKFKRVISGDKFSLEAQWSATDEHTKVVRYNVCLLDVQADKCVETVAPDGKVVKHVFKDLKSIKQGKPYLLRITAFNALQQRGTTTSEPFVFDSSAPISESGKKPVASFVLPSRFYKQNTFPVSLTGATIQAELDSVFFDKETGALGLIFNWKVVCDNSDKSVKYEYIDNYNSSNRFVFNSTSEMIEFDVYTPYYPVCARSILSPKRGKLAPLMLL